ncbi:MAG: hypothetical protein G01um101433_575 [Parcubacteria group bacterium Gr01-1014_33]|nr:MAG: hypothetical protein G01um101433_575 [Parcubacteria group bacterium Gr01-1014_33]
MFDMETQSQEPTKGDFKKSRIDEAIRRKEMRLLFWIGGIAVIAGLLVGGIIWAVKARNQNLPGAAYPDQGQDHVALDHAFDYNSNPPSSGHHYGQPANWGIYDYEVNDKIFVHNLEHGGIWIAYRPSVSAKIVEELKAIAAEFNNSKIVMAPRQTNDADVAIVAWTKVLKLDHLGDTLRNEQKEQIRAFYKAFKNHGPEFVPDTMPGVDPKSVQ